MADPKYREIANRLIWEIEAGSWLSGAQLPSEEKLQERYGVSRNTIREAVRTLINQGVLETRHGAGTFVVKKIRPMVVTMSAVRERGPGGGEGDAYVSAVQEEGRDLDISSPRVEIQKATAPIAEALRIDEGSQVVSRNQERRIDGEPWSLQTSCYPFDFVTRGATLLLLADSIQQGAVAYIEETLKVKQTRYHDEIIARQPNQGELFFFGAGNLMVLESRRTSYDLDDNPIRLTTTVYAADRNVLAYDVSTLTSG